MKSVMNKHIRTGCGTISEYKCALCDGAFYTVAELKEHNEQHVKDKSPVCTTCGKAFEKLSSLKLHVIHAHRKPFQCRYCGSWHRRRLQLLRHLSDHTGILPFKCLSCNAKFSSHFRLEMHRKKNLTTCNLIPYAHS